MLAGALKRIRSFAPFETLKIIFNASERPHFDYCSVVWGNCNLTLSNKLQKLQNRAARILTFSSYDTDVEDLFSKLGWRKLSSQREIQKAIMVFKSLNGLTPEYLSDLFVNRSDVTEYLLRDSVNKLSAVPLPRTNFLKNSFSYSAPLLFNSLPSDLRRAESLSDFSHLLNSFYPLK